jgi:hypothetical protein
LELPDAERATRRREARGSRGRGDCGRKGKAGGWDPPISCPGRMEREGSRRFAMVGWAGGAGPCHAGWLAGKKEGERGRESWAARVGPVSGYWTKGVRRLKLGFEFE